MTTKFLTLCICVFGFTKAEAQSSIDAQDLTGESVSFYGAAFEADITPPIGSPLAYITMTWVDKPLSARGVVLKNDNERFPIVLCSLDWIGVGNAGQDAWKEALAEAAGTIPERVCIHTVHQHDAPVCDFSTFEILFKHGVHTDYMNPVFARKAISNTAHAVQKAVKNLQPISRVGIGEAEVKEVASNRRILGEDGKVIATRWTANKDPELAKQPVGVIDPNVKLISFWNDEAPIAILSFYATHPQSYYRVGGASPDFPGLARELRQTQMNGVTHIHFAAAGGNIGAGKWNDGNPENRIQLAIKLANGMKRAWDNTEILDVRNKHLDWKTKSVKLPVSKHLDSNNLKSILESNEKSYTEKSVAAAHLAWIQRAAGNKPNAILQRVRIGKVDILLLPGEVVVEYQLEAQQYAPGRFVSIAAYGDYGPGYICKEIHYSQGGYESSARASRVQPSVDAILSSAIQELLD